VFTAEKYSPFNYSANNTALNVEIQTSSIHKVIRNGKRREETLLMYTHYNVFSGSLNRKRAPAGTL